MWLCAPATLVHVKRQRLQVGKDLQNFLSRGVKALKKAKGPEGKYEHPSVDKVKTYWTCLIGQQGHYDLEEEEFASLLQLERNRTAERGPLPDALHLSDRD